MSSHLGMINPKWPQLPVENSSKMSEGGFEPPAPGYLPERVTRPAMSPVLYRAEPLRQE